MLLRSDCGNLALSVIYGALKESGHYIQIYSLSSRESDLYMFGSDVQVKNIEELGLENLNFFDCIIVSRNCFFIPKLEEALTVFKGIIITEHTTPYEGDNVYGDAILCGSQFNVDSVDNVIKEGTSFHLVGNIKCFDKERTIPLPAFFDNSILFIESGHYPFGKDSRLILAKRIVQLAKDNPSINVIVKPRYLIDDCKTALHRNADHIYNYFADLQADKIPNLFLLDYHVHLASAIKKASVVIHTYSSAFVEAVYFDKKIINISNLPSIETVDFRENRFNQIKRYIDMADMNVSFSEELELKHAKKCSGFAKEYFIAPLLDLNHVVGIIESEVDGFKYNKNTYINRLKGIIKNRLNFYATRFDDFCEMAKIFRNLCLKIDINTTYTDAIKLINEAIYLYICEHVSELCKDKINRAALLEYVYSSNNWDLIDFDELPQDEAYMLFVGLKFYNEGCSNIAKEHLLSYLHLESSKLFDETCADFLQYQNLAKKVVEHLQEG